MAIDFKPQNALEQAIYDHDAEQVVYAIAENHKLTKLVPASNLGYECFSDEVIFSVLLNAVTEKQLNMMNNGWFYGYLRAGERLRKLIEETLAPLPQVPSEAEKELIKAIVWRDNNEIIRLIREGKVKFQGFTPTLLTILLELSCEAALTFLRDGLSAKLKAVVLRIFLSESEAPELLESFSYDERCKYTNWMIQIIAGKTVFPEEPDSPEGAGEKIG